jgi:hypothetical protein
MRLRFRSEQRLTIPDRTDHVEFPSSRHTTRVRISYDRQPAERMRESTLSLNFLFGWGSKLHAVNPEKQDLPHRPMLASCDACILRERLDQ